MVARHFYRNDDDIMEEILTVPREGWEVKEGAEEGSSESSTIAIPDPEMELDFIPHRRYIIYEDESESDDQVLYSGFVSLDDTGRENGEHFEANARVINLTVVDMNTLFDQRVMVGETDRDEETDIERIEWLVATEEMGYFDDLTLISPANAVTLDARDVAGETPKQLFDEAAQDSDKNYWIGATGNVTDGTDIFVWYAKSSRAAYLSPLSLSNDPDDMVEADLADGSSLVWPLGATTQRHRTGERIYSGVLVEYEGGRKYRKNTTTLATFTLSGRDLVHPAPEIKSEARAGRRADKLLLRLNEPDITVTTTVRLPCAKATMLRAGMLVDIKATHINELAAFTACRILNASIKPVQAGRYYDITIEAEPIGAAGTSSCSTVLSTIEVATADDQFGGPPVASTITPTFDGRIIAINYAGGENTPNANSIDAIDGGYTEILDQPDQSRSTFRVAHKAASAGVGSTATSTSYVRSFADADHWWSIQLALQTAATAPVQAKFAVGDDITLDSAPTVGNIFVLFRECDSAGAGVPDPPASGWTTIFHDTDATLDLALGVFVRCVEATDGTFYEFDAVGAALSQSSYLMEWEIS